MKIAVGRDHRGESLAPVVIERLRALGHEVLELGPSGSDSRDYPDSAEPVARAVADGRADRGLLLCGSGVGMSIAANKVDGVRAALVADEDGAGLARAHNDANVLCLAADRAACPLDADTAMPIVERFLDTGFEGGRHARRVEKITAIERSGG